MFIEYLLCTKSWARAGSFLVYHTHGESRGLCVLGADSISQEGQGYGGGCSQRKIWLVKVLSRLCPLRAAAQVLRKGESVFGTIRCCQGLRGHQGLPSHQLEEGCPLSPGYLNHHHSLCWHWEKKEKARGAGNLFPTLSAGGLLPAADAVYVLGASS